MKARLVLCEEVQCLAELAFPELDLGIGMGCVHGGNIRQSSSQALWPRRWRRSRPWADDRRWPGRQFAAWYTQATLVVLLEGALESGWLQKSVAYGWDNKVADQSICSCQCLLNAACISASSDVQLCSDFLIGQRN